MIRLIAAMLCFVALPAAAQSAYKCSDGKSGSVYQSTPCATGAEQKRYQASSAPAHAASGNAAEPSLGAQMITFTGKPSPEACARAKHVRDQAQGDASMKGEREFHETLQRNVVNACK